MIRERRVRIGVVRRRFLWHQGSAMRDDGTEARPGARGAGGDGGVPPWLAALVAVPLAILAMALLEPFHVPLRDLAGHPAHLLRVPILALPALAGLCAWPIAFQLNTAAVLALPASTSARRVILAVIRAALAAGAAAACYRALARYAPFAGYPPFVGLFCGLAALLFAWSTALGRERLAPALRHGPFAIAAVGFPALYAANGMLFDGEYPTLHESALMISFLLLHAALAEAIVRIGRRRRLPAVALVAAAVIAADLAVAAPAIASGGFAAKGAQIFARYGLSGRAAAARARSADGPDAAAKRRKLPPDFGAEARFAAQSGLPALPAGLDLSRYNVLLVSMEATRVDATSIGAASPGNTPNLQRFAAESFWFTRAYTASPFTMQVFASIFSMTIPSATALDLGEKPWNGRLREEQRTVAELFEAAGRSTFVVSHDYRGLFRHFARGMHQGFESIDLMSRPKDDPDTDVAIAADAIEALRPFAGSDRRFFGWVFFESPHFPYLAHYEAPAETERERYDQEVRFGDEQIGKVLDFVQSSGLADDTIVVFHGDHGEQLHEHGGAQHADVYAEIAHVPLVVRVPGVAGGRVDSVTSLTYLFPWLLLHGEGALRAEAQARLREEIGPLMQRTDGAAVTEIAYPVGGRIALTWPKRRLIYDEDSRYFELYDAARDPGERRNIADEDPEAGEYLQRFARFDEARNALAKWRMQAPTRKLGSKSRPRPKPKR